MPQCPRCKEDVARDAAFCENCGTDLRARGARPGDVILVLDRGLIQFGKFALALLGMFLVVGAFVFGFDLENLVSEMGERRAEMDAARQQVATATDQAEVAVAALNDKLTSAETDIADATTRLEARLADSKVQIDELKTKVAEAETQVSDIKAKVSEAESALRRIRAAREKAEVVVADLLDLSGEQVAAIERRAASELETAEVTLGPPATADRLHSDKLFEPGQTLSYAFLGTASNDVKRLIAEALAEWAAHANLDFRLVEKPADAIIRIGLRRGEGSWAYLGRDALIVPSDAPTINFGWDVARPGQQQTVLSEFGHTIGFPNEHQNPNNGIVWNEEAVYRHFTSPPNNWSREQVYFNILRKLPPEDYPCSREFDPNSIMMFPIPAGLTADGAAITPEPGLSDSDKACAREMYPR